MKTLKNMMSLQLLEQQRFITLIDIIYEKKVRLIISSVSNLNELTSANSLSRPFKRTLSRLHELTSNLNS